MTASTKFHHPTDFNSTLKEDFNAMLRVILAEEQSGVKVNR